MSKQSNTHLFECFSVVSTFYFNAVVAMTRSYQVVGVWICVRTLQWRFKDEQGRITQSTFIIYWSLTRNTNDSVVDTMYRWKVCKKVITWGKNKNCLSTICKAIFGENKSGDSYKLQATALLLPGQKQNSHKPKEKNNFVFTMSWALFTHYAAQRLPWANTL